jgi:hypothetical protein
VYNRGNSEVPEERVCKRKKNDEIQMWERGKGAECAMRRERQLSTCGMDVAKRESGRERNGEKY